MRSAGPHSRTAKNRRRTWCAASRAAEEVRDTKQIEEVQRWFNDETSCVSREHLLNVRILSRQEDRDGAAMLQESDSGRQQHLLQQQQEQQREQVQEQQHLGWTQQLQRQQQQHGKVTGPTPHNLSKSAMGCLRADVAIKRTTSRNLPGGQRAAMRRWSIW